MTVGSLFSGIGGIDLAFTQSGFTIKWAIENDHNCCETYRNNFKDIILLEENIQKINTNSLPKVDVIVAGFPCQSFSIAGRQRGFNDTRGNLFFEILRFVQFHKPRFIFLENVANLIQHNNGRTFQIIYNSLIENGYFVQYRILRASEYGNVPQIRDRIYIVAFNSLEDCDHFQFPPPTKLTCKANNIINRSIPVPDKYYYLDNSPFSIKARKIVKDPTSIYRVYHDSIKPIRNKLCPTLTAAMGTQRNQVPLILDDYGVRKLTPAECLSFQGFPYDFLFPQFLTDDVIYKQIGNSVCTPVIYRIAKNLIKLP